MTEDSAALAVSNQMKIEKKGLGLRASKASDAQTEFKKRKRQGRGRAKKARFLGAPPGKKESGRSKGTLQEMRGEETRSWASGSQHLARGAR